MALPLGKLTLIVGAGLVGSVLAKEGRVPGVSDFFSGAFKIVWNQLKQDDSTTSISKPKNDTLMQQVLSVLCQEIKDIFGIGSIDVNSLRQELQLLASSRPVMIVTGDRSGSGKYGVVIIVVVVGYGFVWWKGWKLSDMMFATRRGLNDACNSVAKQLESVYSSISATKKHLSSRIDRVDSKIDECADNTAATKDEVSELRGDVKLIGADVQSVHQVVRSLETKISRIEGRQNETNFGVGRLVAFVRNIEFGRSIEQIEGSGPSSFMPALELPSVSPTRAVSLPSNSSLEPPSPRTSNGSLKKQATFPLPGSSQTTATAASGLKELHGISNDPGASSLRTAHMSNGSPTLKETNSNHSSGAHVHARNYSSTGVSLLTRSRSVMQAFK